MSAPTPSPELVADIDEIFLGHWDDELVAITRRPYTAGALRAYAWRDGGSHIPTEGDAAGGLR